LLAHPLVLVDDDAVHVALLCSLSMYHVCLAFDRAVEYSSDTGTRPDSFASSPLNAHYVIFNIPMRSLMGTLIH